MKKSLIWLPLICLFANFLSFSAENSQTVIPKNVYTGDTAQVRVFFESSVDLLSDGGVGNGSLEFSTDLPVFHTISGDCLVTGAGIEHNGSYWSFWLNFIPWKPGQICFPAFDVADLIHREKGQGAYGSSFLLNVKPVEILSLSQKMNVSELRPPASPLLLPGSVWLVSLIAGGIFILLALSVILLLKLPSFVLFVQEAKSGRKIKRAVKKARKSLRRLLRAKNLSDQDFAAGIQNILREFLSTRFSRTFDNLPTSRLAGFFEELTGETLSDSQEEEIFDLAGIFTRTDYIRYAPNSADSKRFPQENFAAVCLPGEREKLAEKSRLLIFALSRTEKSDEKSEKSVKKEEESAVV